jgi:hypothetical protein
LKFELTVGVYDGDDLVDTVCYVVPAEPLACIFAQIPEDSVVVSVSIEGVKELYE